MFPPRSTPRPAVYGTPDQLAKLLGSIAALVDREPDESFADVDVRTSAVHLCRLLNGRLDEGKAGGEEE